MKKDNRLMKEALADVALECRNRLNDKAKQFLSHLSITEDSMYEYDLGFCSYGHDSCITIPVYSSDQEIENIRLVRIPEDLPNNDQELEYSTFPNYRQPICFNQTALPGNKSCVIVKGEIEAIIASQQLEVPVIGIPNVDEFRSWPENLANMETIYLRLRLDDSDTGKRNLKMVEDLSTRFPKATIIKIGEKDGD